jgi:hypothetical protein
MFRSIFVTVALAAGLAGEGSVTPTEQAAPLPKKVFGFLWDDGELTRLDSLTLRPVGRRLDLSMGGGSATAFSPDRRTLAIGNDQDASVQFVDVAGTRSLGTLGLGSPGLVTMLSWQRSYLFAVVEDESDPRVAVIDPVRRKLLRRHHLEGVILSAQPGPGTVVLLVAPAKGIGPVDLVVIGGKEAASVRLNEVAGGYRFQNDGSNFRTRQAVPGLAIDDVGRRAIVVPGGSSVAEVSLRDLSVAYHTLAEPVSLLGRLRNWLEPRADAKLVHGPERRAVWLGHGLVAVSGADYAATRDAPGRLDVDVEPAGVSLIDTEDWSIRTIDEDATDIALLGNTLVAFGVTFYEDTSTEGFGLVGYDLDGDRRFHLFEGKGIGWIQPVGPLAYISWNDRRHAVVDVAAGRVLSHPTTKELVFLVDH